MSEFPPPCIICGGDGFEYEQVDDKREKRPCPCRQEAYAEHIFKEKYREEVRAGKVDEEMPLLDHMIQSGYADKMDAKARKIHGMKKVTRNPSKDFLDKVMDSYIKEKSSAGHYEVNADTLKKYCRENFSEELAQINPHPNAWGALFGRYSKRELIKSTGRHVPSTEPSSHGRKIAVWYINCYVQ